ncbi:MAG: filamentous hemagglutinin N-terminal domain-containing protein [Aetokthonos hydrillicola CCALA 1050]|nr:filamentous hemagglutinin N-terminal domain-containing protein [Aetokthonos hydrillicola CCALA 1050]MBW4584658.1 filamentous hemagglutinin N-terminal domain-containing protein [Aetokthonos hydrillicola CCALA 1050]
MKASGSANLFFINPSGIIFGKNASLNVGGSFVATTANAIQFGNLGTFSASVPNNPALLTVNPSALLFNQIATQPIQNNSTASAGVDPAGFDVSGLRVGDGKSLLLVGGNVSMDGGQLNAYGGRVEIGGLATSGTVGLNINGNNLSLGFPASSQRADISLTNGAAVYVEAGGGGSTITGRGGLAPSPYEPLTSDAIWSDIRLPLTTAPQNQPKTRAARIKPKPIEIVPATGWVFNGKGEVTLISSVSNAASNSTPNSCPAR